MYKPHQLGGPADPNQDDWPRDPLRYVATSTWYARLAKEGFAKRGSLACLTDLCLLNGVQAPAPTISLQRRIGICTLRVYGSVSPAPVIVACYQKNERFKLLRLIACWTCTADSVLHYYRALKPVMQRIPSTELEWVAYDRFLDAASQVPDFLPHAQIQQGDCPF